MVPREAWPFSADRASRLYRKYNAIVQSGIPILKRYDIPGASH